MITIASSSPLDQLLERVRACVPRLTKGKKAVLSALLTADKPLTAHEIYALVGVESASTENTSAQKEDSETSIDLVTIYRNLEQFEKLNFVVKTEHSNGGWRYSLTEKPHSHTITCTQCGKAMSMGACIMADVEKIIAERTGFVNIHHIVNFTGACPKCQHLSHS